MFNRAITIDAARPGMTLDELRMGQYSTLLLVMKKVPDAAESVTFILDAQGDSDEGAEFHAERIGDGGADNKAPCLRADNDIDAERPQLIGYRIDERTVRRAVFEQSGDISEQYALLGKVGNAAYGVLEFVFTHVFFDFRHSINPFK